MGKLIPTKYQNAVGVTREARMPAEMKEDIHKWRDEIHGFLD